MKIYVTGGAVRDTLMGLPPKDIDYVVVGSSPAEMEALGFEKVGASFPVYLKNGEEYALARQERKVGVGYNGFEVMYNRDSVPLIPLPVSLIHLHFLISFGCHICIE